MSMHLTALMLQHGPTDPLAKLIALCLTDRANDADLCWPSRADLQARTGASNATITRKLRLLEAMSYIARKQRHNGSTVFRINSAKLRQLELEWQAKRAVQVPEGFEPFPEELAAAPLPAVLQAIEKKGDAHCEHGDAHSEHGDAHSEHLTNHKPVKNLARPGTAKRQPRRLPRESGGAAGAPQDAAAVVAQLSPFQRKQVREGQPLVLEGQRVTSGSPLMLALQTALSILERGKSKLACPSADATAALVGAVASAWEKKGQGHGKAVCL